MTKHKGERAGWVLGLAGLLPFFAGAVAVWAAPTVWRFFAAGALNVYAVVILSFLGGVRWGAEIARVEGPRPGVLALSVLSSLAAWLIVLFGRSRLDLGLLAIAFSAQGLWDFYSPSLPRWMRRLRLVLTTGVVTALVVAFAAP